MCGIFGYITNNNAADDMPDNRWRAAFGRMHHRGPDYSGSFEQQNILLAHHRLSIIDLSAEANQPFHSACGRYAVVFNGEIYNYRELVKKYNINARTTSDTELLAELYAIKQEKVLDDIQGMFAFGVYDKTTHTLMLARDRSGIKPCYYAHEGQTLAFASELKSVTPLLKEIPGLNHVAIVQFLHLGFVPAPHTIYNGIHKLEPGHFLVWKNGATEIKKYFAYRFNRNEQPENTEQYIRQTDVLLNRAVQKQLVADVPVGSFLSGGIDSSLVSCIAAKHLDKKLSTFTIAFADKPNDEAPYAARIARHIGSTHYEERITAADALEQLENIMGLFDEPFADSSALPTCIVSRLAKKHVKVALSGDGGDELFLGYGSYHWASRLSKPRHIWVKNGLRLSKPLLSQRYKRALWVLNYRETSRINAHIFSQEQYLFSEYEVGRLLRPETGKTKAFDELDLAPGDLHPVERQQWFDLHYYLPNDLLTKVDTCSMHHSLEVRVPLLDEIMVEYALGIPVREKLKNGELKYILKKTLLNYLPGELFSRPKQGFSIPLKTWLKTELKYLVDKYLSKEQVETTGIFRVEAVEKLKAAFFSGEDILYNKIWALLVLQRWLVQHTSIPSVKYPQQQ